MWHIHSDHSIYSPVLNQDTPASTLETGSLSRLLATLSLKNVAVNLSDLVWNGMTVGIPTATLLSSLDAADPSVNYSQYNERLVQSGFAFVDQLGGNRMAEFMHKHLGIQEDVASTIIALVWQVFIGRSHIF
jgi:hypothetical protein